MDYNTTINHCLSHCAAAVSHTCFSFVHNNACVRFKGRTCPLFFGCWASLKLETDQDNKEAEWFSIFPLGAFAKAKSWLTLSLFKKLSSLSLCSLLWKNTVCCFSSTAFKLHLYLQLRRSEVSDGVFWSRTQIFHFATKDRFYLKFS